MQIQKILNNNVVITTDQKNNEIVAMGRGLAFQKKIGDEITESAIDKTYHLANSDLFNKFQELLVDVPITYVALIANAQSIVSTIQCACHNLKLTCERSTCQRQVLCGDGIHL